MSALVPGEKTILVFPDKRDAERMAKYWRGHKTFYVRTFRRGVRAGGAFAYVWAVVAHIKDKTTGEKA